MWERLASPLKPLLQASPPALDSLGACGVSARFPPPSPVTCFYDFKTVRWLRAFPWRQAEGAGLTVRGSACLQLLPILPEVPPRRRLSLSGFSAPLLLPSFWSGFSSSTFYLRIPELSVQFPSC